MHLSSILRYGVVAGAVGVFALFAGFFAFAATLPRAGAVPPEAIALDGPPTGMIILTGGRGQRIEAGLHLHAQGLGERVFISGVNPLTNKADLRGMGAEALLMCCVDLGPRARTTRGNAIESSEWLAAHGYERALLVTSDFHLPRALAEMRSVAKGVEVIGIPVASDLAPETGWMSQLSSWRVLFLEYLKFLVVSFRSIF